MITYEYECAACGTVFELEQSIKDQPASTCVRCGAKDVKRLVSGGTFMLKGNGWAKDNYSKTNK